MLKYILVNLATAISLCLGLGAIILAASGLIYPCFGLALLAFAFDLADGFLARKLRAESRFGAVFDSIGDFFTYLAYPAVLAFFVFGFDDLTGMFLLAIFIGAGVWRLARFTRTGLIEANDKKYYIGLPVVFSHLIVLIMIIAGLLTENLLKPLGFLLFGVMSVLMILKFKFRKPQSPYQEFIFGGILILSLIMFFI